MTTNGFARYIYKFLFILLILSIIGYWIFESINGFPLLSGDTICFLPTSYYLELDGELTNHIYNGHQKLPNNEFLWYTPLFPWVVFILNKLTTGVIETHISILIIKIITFIFSLITARTILTKKLISFKISYFFKNYFYLIVIFSIASAITSTSRPELLCGLILSIYCYLFSVKLNKTNLFIQGVLIALAGITSPIFGLYMVALQFMSMLYLDKFYFKEISCVFLGLLSIFFCFVMVYPYTLKDLINNLIIHSASMGNENIFTDFHLDEFFLYHILPYPSFGILLFIYFIVGSFLLIKEKTKHKNLLKASLVFTLLGIIYFSIFKRFTLCYYLYVLSLVFVFITIIIAFQSKRTFIISTIILSLFSLSFFINSYVICYSVLNNSMTIYDLEKDINLQIKDKNASIKFTHQLWPVMIKFPNALPIYVEEENGNRYDDLKSDFIVLQQIMPAKKILQISNYKLIRNTFNPHRVSFFGVYITRSLHGYQYALYKRVKTN